MEEQLDLFGHVPDRKLVRVKAVSLETHRFELEQAFGDVQLKACLCIQVPTKRNLKKLGSSVRAANRRLSTLHEQEQAATKREIIADEKLITPADLL